jgi:pilus assembly protein Flp/PilA
VQFDGGASQGAAKVFRNGSTAPVDSRNSGSLLIKEMTMLEVLKQFVQEEDGVTAIEYGLIAALIGVAIIAGATVLGTNLNALFTYISGLVKAP